MCPFGMIGVPAKREYFGRFKGGYEAKAGSLAGYRSRGNNKKRAPRIDLPKEGRRAHWTEHPRRGVESSLGPTERKLPVMAKPPILP
jgi:hypothetical protein